MKVVIPAGGLGTRFLPLSSVVPKELLLLADRPLIHHALDESAHGGLEAAVIVTAPWKRPLFERYLELADLPLAVELVEQPEPRGIGDAVLRAVPNAGQAFAVLLPDDVITQAGHWRQLTAAGAPAVCVRPVPAAEIHRFGIVALRDGRAVQVVEKPAPGSIDSNLAILGRYLIDGEVLAALERLGATSRDGELQLTDGLAAARDLRVVHFTGDIYDCGTPDSYLEATARWYARRSNG